MNDATKEVLLRRHAEKLALSMVEERHEISRALFDLLAEVKYLRVKFSEVNEYAERRGNNADGWQERAMKAEGEVKRLAGELFDLSGRLRDEAGKAEYAAMEATSGPPKNVPAEKVRGILG